MTLELEPQSQKVNKLKFLSMFTTSEYLKAIASTKSVTDADRQMPKRIMLKGKHSTFTLLTFSVQCPRVKTPRIPVESARTVQMQQRTV